MFVLKSNCSCSLLFFLLLFFLGRGGGEAWATGTGKEATKEWMRHGNSHPSAWLHSCHAPSSRPVRLHVEMLFMPGMAVRSAVSSLSAPLHLLHKNQNKLTKPGQTVLLCGEAWGRNGECQWNEMNERWDKWYGMGMAGEGACVCMAGMQAYSAQRQAEAGRQ